MDWFTDCAFRQIVKEIFDIYGEKKYELILRTEFMNADGYIINPPGVIKHLLTDKDQSPVIAQIFWSDETMLLKCFADIQTKYRKISELRVKSSEKNPKSWTMNSESIFSGIELNMGCPARNVMHTWWWSALLRDRKQTLNIIKKLSWIMKIPLSIKTRTGTDEHDLEEQMKFLIEVSKYVSMITIHGRTVKQWYTAESNWDFVYELKKQITGRKSQVTKKEPAPWNLLPETPCKILWNGGIKNYEDIKKLQWDLDWVMIGQAAIGNPRIFTPHLPSREEIKTTILKHLNYMISYENYFQEQKAKYQSILVMPEKLAINVKNPQTITLAEFRKHLFQYVKWIPWSKEFKQKVSTIIEYNSLVEEIQKFFW